MDEILFVFTQLIMRIRLNTDLNIVEREKTTGLSNVVYCLHDLLRLSLPEDLFRTIDDEVWHGVFSGVSQVYFLSLNFFITFSTRFRLESLSISGNRAVSV
jgi:hypothetical protein